MFFDDHTTIAIAVLPILVLHCPVGVYFLFSESRACQMTFLAKWDAKKVLLCGMNCSNELRIKAISSGCDVKARLRRDYLLILFYFFCKNKAINFLTAANPYYNNDIYPRKSYILYHSISNNLSKL